jgi:hypothetical protein
MRLKLDAKLRCTDGYRGKLSDIVIDPSVRRVTHVVVESRADIARLVPLDLVATPAKLRCTGEELHAFEALREYAFLNAEEYPHGDDAHDIGVENVITTPITEGLGCDGLDTRMGLTYDRIPRGDAELRSSSDVYSSAGNRVGHIDSVLVADGVLTHIVAREGHFWRSHTVSIPIDAVSEIATDRVQTSLA